MASLTSIIQGIGGEAPFVEEGRRVRRQERREDLQDKMAQEELGLHRQQIGIQSQGIQARLAELQRRLQKDSEWKTVGQPKQGKDGGWYQLKFQPETGATKLDPVAQPEGAEFYTQPELAGQKTFATEQAKAQALQALRKAGMSDEAIGAAFPQLADKLHYMSTQSGIVGFNTNPYGKPGSVMTPFQGYPPNYTGTGPGGNMQLDETDMGYIDQLARNQMTIDMVKKIYAGKNEYKLPMMIGQAIRMGHDPNAQLSSTASQQVATAQSQIDINKPLIDLIDQLGLKENNSPGYLMWARLKYGAGKNTPGGLADEIANLELTKVTSAANALKGSSRAWAALSLALQHTPNAWIDSPSQIRRKLETINQRLQAVIDEQRRFGTKSGLPNRGVDTSDAVGWYEPPGGKRQNIGPQPNQQLPNFEAPVRPK